MGKGLMLDFRTGQPLIGRIARYTVAIVLLLVISVGVSLVGPKDLDAAASIIILAYIAVPCLLLPFRAGVLCFLGVIGIVWVLQWVNEEKIALTQLPLTGLDIRIALTQPQRGAGA